MMWRSTYGIPNQDYLLEGLRCEMALVTWKPKGLVAWRAIEAHWNTEPVPDYVAGLRVQWRRGEHTSRTVVFEGRGQLTEDIGNAMREKGWTPVCAERCWDHLDCTRFQVTVRLPA